MGVKGQLFQGETHIIAFGMAINFCIELSRDKAAADKIAFKSNRIAGAPWEIWVMNSDGGNPVRITNSQFSNGDPSWSPDGTKIVFSAYRNGGNGISIINADGTNETRLLDSSGSEPRWEP